MKEKKSSIMVLMAALMGMTVSAATLELNDAQWSSMVVEPHTSHFDLSTLTSSTNYPRDPGFRWDVNIVQNGYWLGFIGISADTNTLGITVNPGDIWEATFTNPSDDTGDYYPLTLTAYVTSSEGYTGWVIGHDLYNQDETWMFGQSSKTFSWDLTTGQVSNPGGLPQTVTITSVLKLGWAIAGDYSGGGEDLAVLRGSTEAYNYGAWLEEKYPDLDVAQTNKTSNPDGDALDNWNEYAFGGNPTNAADTGYPVEYGIVEAGGTYLAYFHVQRKGTEDLDYVVGTSDSLPGGSWSWTNGIGIIAVTNADFAMDFAGVTNLVPMDVDERFIRLHALEK